MTINRGSVLSKEYFISYFHHLMTVFNYTIDEAKEKAEESLFRGNLDSFGKQTSQIFEEAYLELRNNQRQSLFRPINDKGQM